MWEFALNVWLFSAVYFILLDLNCDALTVKIWPAIVRADQRHKTVVLDCLMDDEDKEKFNSISAILFEDMFGNVATAERGKMPTWNMDYGDVRVSGSSIESSVPSPFLQVTIDNVVQGNWYCCRFYGRSKKTNRTYNEIAWGHVAYDNSTPAMLKLIDDFKIVSQRISNLEGERKSKHDGYYAELVKLRGELENQTWAFGNESSQTDGLMARQDLALGELERIENARVMFTAIQSSGDRVFKNGHPVVYSRVTANKGAGYNTRNGYFTPPVPGYYLFQFSVFVNKGSYIYMDLKSQDSRTLKKIVGGAQDNWQRFSEGSCVVKLDLNQAVYMTVSGGSAKTYTASGRRRNQFAGYLLKASTNTTMQENSTPYRITRTNK